MGGWIDFLYPTSVNSFNLTESHFPSGKGRASLQKQRNRMFLTGIGYYSTLFDYVQIKPDKITRCCC